MENNENIKSENGQNVSSSPALVAGNDIKLGENAPPLPASGAAACSASDGRGIEALIQEIGERVYPLCSKEVRVVDITMADKYLKSESEKWVIVGANVVVARL